MATYEKVIRETARFDVVDATDRKSTVIEYTTLFLRVSLHRQYGPKLGGIGYQLPDGRAVHRTHGGHFDTSDGLCRFFVAGEERAAVDQTCPNGARLRGAFTINPPGRTALAAIE
jgi:hypothetical protein